MKPPDEVGATRDSAAASQWLSHEFQANEWLARLRRVEAPSPGSSASAAGSAGAAAAMPDVVGNYRILRLLGTGGMGAVFEAEQQNPRRTVALKVVRPGHASAALLRRFELEAQLLGRLQHAGVAQVYEAGLQPANDGGPPQPFFAMELVRGEPLGQYAERQRLALRARLELLARVADAVQHAHTQGIIHRDLKPANILVTAEGQPKVLDFGVARATDSDLYATQYTEAGVLIGTLAYMSPEQAGGQPEHVDTRSDVYALGVIGYELVTGQLPYELAGQPLPEMVRIIREAPPRRPRSLNAAVPVDVETIVLKAMEKDKERRYATAAALAADLRRFLNHEPIAARPPSAAYQFARFARRNRVLVAGVAATFLALFGGLVGTSLALNRALISEGRERRESARADEEARAAQRLANAESAARRRAETISTFVVKALQSGDPQTGGKQETTILGAMDSAIAEIEAGAFRDQPETEASLKTAIAQVLENNGRAARAEPLLRQALETQQQTYTGDHPAVAGALNNLGQCLKTLGRAREALEVFEAALAMYQRLYPDDQLDVATTLNNLASCLGKLGRSADALPRFQESLAMRQRLLVGDHPDLAYSYSNIAGCLEDQGRAAEALPQYESALAMFQRLHPGDHPDTAGVLNNLGYCYKSLGKYAEALPHYEAALAMKQRMFHADHPDTELSLGNLAACLDALGRSEEALPHHRACVEMSQRLHRGDHPAVAASLNNLAYCLDSLGRCEEALPRFEEVLAMLERLFPGDHPHKASSLTNIAGCLESLGRVDEALLKYQVALATYQRLFQGDHPAVATGLNNVGFALGRLKRHEEALPYLQSGLEMFQRLFPAGHPQVANSLNHVGANLRDTGQLVEARSKLEAARAMAARTLPSEHVMAVAIALNLGGTLTKLEQFADAESVLLGSSQVMETAPAVRAQLGTRCGKELITLYDAWHAAQPDQGHDLKAAEWRAKLAAP